MRKAFAAALLTIALTACGGMTMPGSETDRAYCEAWGNSLPTRSRSDTSQTQAEIQEAYADFEAACPQFSALIP